MDSKTKGGRKMTRKELLDLYQVNDRGRITDPGKFEGEMLFVPYFWDIVLNGFGNATGEFDWVDISREDRAEFPEVGRATKIRLHECESGFVFGDLR
jgi:hypothetical protein